MDWKEMLGPNPSQKQKQAFLETLKPMSRAVVDQMLEGKVTAAEIASRLSVRSSHVCGIIGQIEKSRPGLIGKTGRPLHYFLQWGSSVADGHVDGLALAKYLFPEVCAAFRVGRVNVANKAEVDPNDPLVVFYEPNAGSDYGIAVSDGEVPTLVFFQAQ